MKPQLHIDPLTGTWEEVYPVKPGNCRFCETPINAYAVMNYSGCCEECWDCKNGNEQEQQQMQEVCHD